MSDENKKTDTGETVAAKDKPETVKKPAAATKKVKAKSNEDSGKDDNKQKIVEKLQAMGVMSGGETNIKENSTTDKGSFTKVVVASVAAVLVVGSFVWALDKEVANEKLASSSDIYVMPSAYPGAWHPSQNNNSGSRAFNNNHQQRVQLQQEQQNKWMQQQQQSQEQQRAQQQKWAQQWQLAQEQQRAQRQKWPQQQPTQEQYRDQQQKWTQQRQLAQEQQRAQQQKWAEQQQRQAQEQYRAQQQKWAQQQPYYGYVGNQRQRPAPSSYNTAPRYQQPGPYYGPRY